MYYYRPQRSLGKVMFLQVCVILFTGGVCLSACWDAPPEQRPPWSRPPRSRHPRGADTPLGADTPPGSRQPLGADPPHPPGAEHATRYGQRARGTRPTGMQSCFMKVLNWPMPMNIPIGGYNVFFVGCSSCDAYPSVQFVFGISYSLR